MLSDLIKGLRFIAGAVCLGVALYFILFNLITNPMYQTVAALLIGIPCLVLSLTVAKKYPPFDQLTMFIFCVIVPIAMVRTFTPIGAIPNHWIGFAVKLLCSAGLFALYHYTRSDIAFLATSAMLLTIPKSLRYLIPFSWIKIALIILAGLFFIWLGMKYFAKEDTKISLFDLPIKFTHRAYLVLKGTVIIYSVILKGLPVHNATTLQMHNLVAIALGLIAFIFLIRLSLQMDNLTITMTNIVMLGLWAKLVYDTFLPVAPKVLVAAHLVLSTAIAVAAALFFIVVPLEKFAPKEINEAGFSRLAALMLSKGLTSGGGAPQK